MARCEFVLANNGFGIDKDTAVDNGGRRGTDDRSITPGTGEKLYRIPLESAAGWFGSTDLYIDDRELFRPYETAVHNLISSLAMRMENLEHRQRLQNRVREQTAELERNRIELERALADRERLLREIYHRIKNSLNMVTSLVRLQLGDFEDEKVRAAVDATIHRIESTALVHELLYQSDTLKSIDFRALVKRVVDELSRGQGTAGVVRIITDIVDAPIGIDEAIPVTLMVNELVTNALKYAFPDGRKGRIVIRMVLLPHNFLELSVVDDGVGLPPMFNLETTDSLGMQLLRGFAEQINGGISVSGTAGTAVTVKFPVTTR